MASSLSVPAFSPQDVQPTHAEKSGQKKPCLQSSITVEALDTITGTAVAKLTEPPVSSAIPKSQTKDASDSPVNSTAVSVNATAVSGNATTVTVKATAVSVNPKPVLSVTSNTETVDAVQQPPTPLANAATATTERCPRSDPAGKALSPSATLADKPLAVSTGDSKETEKATQDSNLTDSALKPSSKADPLSAVDSGLAKPSAELTEVTGTSTKPDTVNCTQTGANKNSTNSKPNNNKRQLEDGEEPEKKSKVHISNSGKEGRRSPQEMLELMDKTFEQRRRVVTKQMPTIPELKEMYPDLFTGKQLLLEFQRITKIDIDQKIQEFCVRHATAVIELARHKKEAAPVIARWEQAKQENDTLKQYWDMVTALCLLPLHFEENFVEMVLEIGEDEEVVAQGKIVPTLVARGNIFRTDEFFLIAENTIVQEFEEFTIAFASLYSSYWVFNMEYPQTIENTYNYIQRCIVRQREPGTIPVACKNFTKTLLKWNKGKDGK